MEKRGVRDVRGQVTIFVILAIVIVAGIVIYFVLRGGISSQVSPELQPAYDYYLSCLEAQTGQGVELMGLRGGHLEIPEFEQGSQYRPFSSQLDFLGQPVPYWMYVSGNNFLREQVPTKGEMEEDLANFVADRVGLCDFSGFESQGFEVFVDDNPQVDVNIKDNEVDVSVSNRVSIVYADGEEIFSADVNKQEVSVDSQLGNFYGLARDVYDYEKENMFMELYALDVMTLYAPVTGVEIGCTPKVFNKEQIVSDLKEGFEANVAYMKLGGDYYDLSSKENEYFVTDVGRDIGGGVNVNFVYSSDWPTKIEIAGDEVVEPIGLQEGLGILGFCYVPYHFVYDINLPILVQFYSSDGEIFQFPIGVVIDRNQARESLPTETGTLIESEVCQYKNQGVDIYTYDTKLNPVEATISFKCLDSNCPIGTTELENGEAVLRADFPQCVNGFITARAEGYSDASYQISTNEESVADILMKKKYSLGLDLGDVDMALVTFSSEDYTRAVVYPEFDSVELVEGFYNVSVLAYDNSSLTIPAVSETKCVEVPQQGAGSIIGLTDEKCFDINIPETEVEMAIVGGGETREYIDEGRLESSSEININVPLFGTPSSLEDLRENYALVEEEVVYVEFE